MRNISTASLDLLTGKTAIESILIVAIQWVDGGGTFYYADRDVYDGDTLVAAGKITELSNFDDVTRADGAGRNGSCTVTLSDIDGALKGIFDNSDIHKRPVTVYQYFEGIAWTDKFPILEGQINTPLIWTESERTLQFDVVSLLESYQVGYDISMGNSPVVPQELLGTPWPLIFGSVAHYPALQLRNVPTGFTTDSFGIPDPALSLQLASMAEQKAACDQAAKLCFLYAALACYDNSSYDTLAQSIESDDGSADCNQIPAVQSFNQQAAQFESQSKELQTQMHSLTIQQGSQAAWFHGTNVIPNISIQVPYTGLVRINNQLFEGTITATGGSIVPRPVLQPGQLPGIATQGFTETGNTNGLVGTLNATNPNLIGNTYVKQGFQFFSAGSQVSIAGPYPIPFAVSLIPGTVNAVWAYRSYNGIRQLAPVPTDWYTVGTMSVGNYNCVTVTLDEPLSVKAWTFDTYASNWDSNFGQFLPSHIVPKVDWEDDLYISFTSSVGPNTVDIIIWLIETYCPGLSYDATSFNHVRTLLANYPMNFGLSAEPNVIDLINELAYQNRCSVWITNNTFHILYRPLLTDPVATITEDDVEAESLTIECTPTESLVTKYVGTYRPDYSPTYQEPVSVILRNHVALAKYGLNQATHDFYAFNNYYEVEKSATYWMIQDSTSWKILKCKLMLNMLNLETFDIVTLNFSHPYVANGPVPAMVQSCSYNSADHSIDAEFWVPVRLGEMSYYPFAWPAGLTEQDIFPNYFPISGGGGASLSGGNSLPLFNSQSQTVTIGDPASGGPFGLQRASYDSGDPQPSDTGDSYVTLLPTPVAAPSSLRAAPDLGDYNFNTPVTATISTPPMGGATFPGKITSYGGQDSNGNSYYQVEGYPYGLAGPKKSIDVVNQLQLDADDRIPEGTWTQITVCQVNKNGTQSNEYTMQVPIWLD